MKTAENKAELMRGSGKLKGSGLWVEEDATDREEMVQDWLKKERARLERAGLTVRTKKLMAKVGNTIWSWNEETGCMVVVSTEGKDGEEERGEEDGESKRKRESVKCEVSWFR